MKILELHHLSHHFAGDHGGAPARTILDGVNLTLDPQEILALIGPSGVGKTTLLYLAAGLCRPSMGRVLFDGVDLNLLSASDLSRLRRDRIGLIFQNNLCISAIPAWENAALPLLLKGTRRDAARERTMSILDWLGLAEWADATTSALSGGQRRRLGIARALLGEPKLILADEPTADLDEVTGARIEANLFEWLRHHRQAALIVTHHPSLERAADRTLKLAEGKLNPVRLNEPAR